MSKNSRGGALKKLLKDPLSNERFGKVGAAITIVLSAVADALFQATSFQALSKWVLQTVLGYSAVDAEAKVAEVVCKQSTPLWMQFLYGLLMTAFAMVFLLVAAKLRGRKLSVEGRNAGSFGLACSWLVVPALLMLVAAIVIQASLAAGTILSVAAALCCVFHILESCKVANVNGYVALALATVCFLLTAILLVRNHVVTLCSLL
ncbi:MAG: hypothetical protein ACOYJL_03385 [Tractidigestivibacter sp.]|jgi:hypothetical protein|uniref:hypothetical protein n=1 Tax=Tractidigestivibacter sp. TaxID=2847320 RepID=UPI003D93E2F7